MEKKTKEKLIFMGKYTVYLRTELLNQSYSSLRLKLDVINIRRKGGKQGFTSCDKEMN